MEKERINFIDYTKGYGILLVIIDHITLFFDACNILTRYVQCYHVAIFFIISGVLNAYKKETLEPWSIFVVKKYRSLVIPYIWFSLFNSISKLSVLFLTHQLTESVLTEEMIQLFITGNGAVWFLLTLFFAELLYRIIAEFRKDILSVIIAFFCITVCFWFKATESSLGILLLRILGAYSLYVSGVIFGKYILKNYSVNIYSGIGLLILGILSYLILGSDYSFFYARFGDPVASLLAIYLNSFGCIIIFKNINYEFDFWKYLGRNSIIILQVHQIILLFYIYPSKGAFCLLPYFTQWMVAIAIFITTVLLNIPFIQFINNKIPFVIGRRKKYV